jgi:hypothetical protein
MSETIAPKLVGSPVIVSSTGRKNDALTGTRISVKLRGMDTNMSHRATRLRQVGRGLLIGMTLLMALATGVGQSTQPANHLAAVDEIMNAAVASGTTGRWCIARRSVGARWSPRVRP